MTDLTKQPRPARENPVSWRAAWRKGLAVAADNRVLLALVAVAVLCERSLSYLAPWMGADGGALLAAAMGPDGSLAKGAFPPPDSAESRMLALGGILFLLGLLLIVGVVTLIRDLLLEGRYRAAGVLGRGTRYLWPILKFKLPLYGVASLVSLTMIGVLWSLSRQGMSGFWPVALALGGLWLCLFGVARVFLSLGVKILITEHPPRVRSVYARVIQIVWPRFAAVIVFYLVLMAVSAAAALLAWGGWQLPAPAPLRAGLSIFVLAAATLVMKAASFALYLQLARAQELSQRGSASSADSKTGFAADQGERTVTTEI